MFLMNIIIMYILIIMMYYFIIINLIRACVLINMRIYRSIYKIWYVIVINVINIYSRLGPCHYRNSSYGHNVVKGVIGNVCINEESRCTIIKIRPIKQCRIIRITVFMTPCRISLRHITNSVTSKNVTYTISVNNVLSTLTASRWLLSQVRFLLSSVVVKANTIHTIRQISFSLSTWYTRI